MVKESVNFPESLKEVEIHSENVDRREKIRALDGNHAENEAPEENLWSLHYSYFHWHLYSGPSRENSGFEGNPPRKARLQQIPELLKNLHGKHLIRHSCSRNIHRTKPFQTIIFILGKNSYCIACYVIRILTRLFIIWERCRLLGRFHFGDMFKYWLLLYAFFFLNRTPSGLHGNT